MHALIDPLHYYIALLIRKVAVNTVFAHEDWLIGVTDINDNEQTNRNNEGNSLNPSTTTNRTRGRETNTNHPLPREGTMDILCPVNIHGMLELTTIRRPTCHHVRPVLLDACYISIESRHINGIGC